MIQYLTELTRTEVADYFGPNLWPNTPDILHEQLQSGLASVFIARLVLAATLSASYGIYGPAYELREYQPRHAGSEEYLDSEKYQLRAWNHDDPESLAPLIARVNAIRRENAALHANHSLRFLDIDNEQLIAYAKVSDDGINVVVTVVNLDPYNVHSGWLEFDPADFDVEPGHAFQMHDLLSNRRFTWEGGRHFVRLDPASMPAHILRLRRRTRDERDFDYFF